PYLFGWQGHRATRFTSGLLEESSLSVLMRPNGQPPATDTPDETAFELFIRSFGASDAPARRLIDQVAAWDTAGRPATSQLHIRAYPLESGYVPAVAEVVVPKRWTQQVLSWQ